MGILKGLNKDPLLVTGNAGLVFIYAHESTILWFSGYILLAIVFTFAMAWAAYGLIGIPAPRQRHDVLGQYGEHRAKSLIATSAFCYSIFIWNTPGILPPLVYSCIVTHALICSPRLGLIGNLLFAGVLCIFSLFFIPNVLAISNALPLILISVLCFFILRHLDQLQTDLEQSRKVDNASGCQNQNALQKELEHCGNLNRRYNQNTTLILFKIENIGDIRNEHGQKHTDIFVAEFANVIKSRLRLTDAIYRYDGKNFIVLLSNTGINESHKVHSDLVTSLDAYDFDIKVQPILITKQVDIRKAEHWEDWLNRCLAR